MALNPNYVYDINLLPKRRNLSGGRVQTPTLQLNGSSVSEERQPLILNTVQLPATKPFKTPSPKLVKDQFYHSDLTEIVTAHRSSPAVISLSDNQLSQKTLKWTNCSICHAYTWCKCAVVAGLLALVVLSILILKTSQQIKDKSTDMEQVRIHLGLDKPMVSERPTNPLQKAVPKQDKTAIVQSIILGLCDEKNPNCRIGMVDPPVIHGTIKNEETVESPEEMQTKKLKEDGKSKEIKLQIRDPVYKFASKNTPAEKDDVVPTVATEQKTSTSAPEQLLNDQTPTEVPSKTYGSTTESYKSTLPAVKENKFLEMQEDLFIKPVQKMPKPRQKRNLRKQQTGQWSVPMVNPERYRH